MAVSFSRPDPSSSSDVANASFNTVRRGFDPSEVRDFLRMVSAELVRLQERERFLERELLAAQTPKAIDPADLDPDLVTALVGEETARVLATAREAAAQIRARAEDGAERLLREAQEAAVSSRAQADLDIARQRQDAQRDAAAEMERARQQGREMVTEAREYRERVVADLNRRRETSRQQLERMIAGRERLVQAFERARLVSADILSEVGAFTDESDDLGPLPIAHAEPTELGQARLVAEAEPVSPVEVAVVAVHPAEHLDERVEVQDIDDADDVEDFGITAQAHVVVVETVFFDDEAEVDEAEVDAAESDERGADAGAEGDQVDAADEDLADAAAVEAEAAGEAGPGVIEGSQDDDEASATVAEPVASPEPVEPLAPVVALFGQATQDRAGSQPEPITRSVDDLFARLKAARTDDIARSMSEPAPAPVDTSVPDPVPDAGEIDAQADESAADDDTVDPFVQRSETLSPLEVSLARRLKRVLADEQNDALDVLRQRTPVTSVAQLLPSAADHLGWYVEAALDDLYAAAVAGASSVDAVSAERRVRDRNVVDDVLALIEPELVEPLRRRVTEAIADAAGENADVALHLRGIYRETKAPRLDDLAGSLLRLAYGSGRYAASTPGAACDWRADPQFPQCADAATNRDGIVGEAFMSGDRFPPAHAECHCLLLVHDD